MRYNDNHKTHELLLMGVVSSHSPGINGLAMYVGITGYFMAQHFNKVYFVLLSWVIMYLFV